MLPTQLELEAYISSTALKNTRRASIHRLLEFENEGAVLCMLKFASVSRFGVHWFLIMIFIIYMK